MAQLIISQVSMSLDGGRTFGNCMSVPDVHLPRGLYFGLSASTGHLADNHDIISMEVFEGAPLDEEERALLRKSETEAVRFIHIELQSGV